MSKYFLLLILLTASMATFAKEETVILLKDFPAGGKKGAQETVIAGENFLMVNAEKLSPAEIITQSQHIKKISEFKSVSSLKRCEAGRFEHILKKGKVFKKECGCLESDRYQELKAGFKALAKDTLTESK